MRDDVAASRPSRRRRHALVRRREVHPRPSARPRRVHRTSAAPPSGRRWPLRLLRRRGHVCGGQPRGQHEHRRGRCEREQGSTDDKRRQTTTNRYSTGVVAVRQAQAARLSCSRSRSRRRSHRRPRLLARHADGRKLCFPPTASSSDARAFRGRTAPRACTRPSRERRGRGRHATRHGTRSCGRISCWARRRLPTTSARRSRPRWSWGPTAACCRPASSSTTARDRRAARRWP